MRDRSTKMLAVLMVSLMAVVALAPLAGEETDAATPTRWLYGMGDNASSQQGNGTTNNVTTPTQIGSFENVTFVVNSYNSTFFIDSGKLYGMGSNSKGQQGNGTSGSTNVTTPTQIGSFENVTFVAASTATTFFIDSGKLYGMGANGYGQQGNDTFVDVTTPTQIGSFENVTFVDAEEYVTFFIDSGKLYGMGNNYNGQMANGQSGNNAKVKVPTQIGDFTNVTLLSIGPDSVFFVDSGKVYGLGRNQYGQMGNGTSGSTNVTTPTQIGDFTNVSCLVDSGGVGVLIIDSGKAYGWGYNYNGQLCTGDENNVTTPTQIGSFENVTGISYGYSNLYIIDSGKLYGAGGNDKGQLGGTVLSNVTTPKQIGDFTNVRSVSGEYGSTYFIDSGKLYGLGDNSKGQMGDGTLNNVTTPTQIGDFTNVKEVKGYYASYSTFFIAGPNSVTATIETNEPTYGSVSSSSVSVDPGSEISATGNVLTIGSETVTATPTAATSTTYYAFESWSGIPADGLLTDDATITANFSASPILTVTLDAGKGTVSSSSISVIEGQPIGDLPTPTPKAGYTFTGWFDSEGNEVTSETIVTETESFTLYAQYELDDSLKPVKAMTDLLPLIFVVGIIILMIGTAFYYYRP